MRLYDYIGDYWTKVGDYIDGEGRYYQSGYCVSIYGYRKTMTIGAPTNYRISSLSGLLWVYDHMMIPG